MDETTHPVGSQRCVLELENKTRVEMVLFLPYWVGPPLTIPSPLRCVRFPTVRGRLKSLVTVQTSGSGVALLLEPTFVEGTGP